MYIFGGTSTADCSYNGVVGLPSDIFLNDVFQYNIETGAISVISPLSGTSCFSASQPCGRWLSSMTIMNNTLFIFGGVGSSNSSSTFHILDDLWAFDLASSTWSLIDAISPPGFRWVCMYVCMYVCVYECMFVYMYVCFSVCL